MARIELLAPAGQPDAGYAALHYGADAVYLGLSQFSARAEAVNFTPDELAAFVRHAHSLAPRRRVYLTLNTLIKEDELAQAAEVMMTAAACGVDALIVQDAGVAEMARENFPNLELHASTQMAVHNTEGARAAARLGFSRVTLARELTLAEIADIRAGAGIDVETFVHGTLCYSYSGLCLFSSILTGRSGNRGRCVYSCREAADTPAGRLHPFSLKDMALTDRAADLARAGVASLKIEGRKKSPLYVAATVDYYRRILDGTMRPEEKDEYEARLQTIFARPWTRFFLDSTRNADAADTGVVGHRGAPLGTVRRLVRTPAGPGLSFLPSRAVERHDGLQIDVPGNPRPFGFGIDNLYRSRNGRLEAVFAVPAGEEAAVAIPEDAPPLSPGLPLYQSSSQEVKRSYPFPKPRDGGGAGEIPLRVAVNVTAVDGDNAHCRAVCTAIASLPRGLAPGGRESPFLRTVTATLPAFAARDADGAERAAHEAFERTGGSRFGMKTWAFANPDDLFVRPGDWNRVRRELMAALEKAYGECLDERRRDLAARVAAAPKAETAEEPAVEREFAWSVVADDPEALSAFTREDDAEAAEVIVAHDADPERLAALARRFGRERLRLSLPMILRGVADSRAAASVRRLTEAGWRRWFLGGLGGLEFFRGLEGVDLAADWSLYVLNHLAAERLTRAGFSSLTLSPEDDAANLRTLLPLLGDRAWITVYADLPLFLSAACAHDHLGLCHASEGMETEAEPMEIRMEKSGRVRIIPQGCGSVVTGTPYSLANKLKILKGMGALNFRVDLRWHRRTPENALALWRSVRNGDFRGGTEGNFSRGLA